MRVPLRAPSAAAPLLLLLCHALTAPMAAHAASLALDKGPVVLGQTESVGVTVRVAEAPGTEDRPLRLSVNVGSFGEVTRVGPGEYRVLYTPPQTRFPQVALVAAWRETGPEAPIDFLRIPLYGMTKIDVAAPASSEVKVEIGLDEFGPVTTSARGVAVVPVLVPPNVPEAVVKVKEASGSVTRRKVPVAVPPYNRLTLALVPHALVANGKDWSRLEVLYEGQGDVPAERLQLRASLGNATLLRSERGGRYVYRYVAPPGATEKRVSFEVSVRGDATSRGTAELSLGLPPAARVSVIPPAVPLLADGTSRAAVGVRVFDANGLGLPEQRLELLANGAPLGQLEYRGNGLYETTFVAPAQYPQGGLVQFAVTVTREDGTAASATANYQVQPLPVPKTVAGRVEPSPVLADGSSKGTVLLDVRDSAGLPLNGAKLILVTRDGVVSPVSEVGEGRYRAEYRAPAELPAGGEALIQVVDASGTFSSSLAVPLRRHQRLLAGVRAGLAHSLGDQVGGRLGLDLWAPFRVNEVELGFGVAATFGRASQDVVGPGGNAGSSRARFVPVVARLGYQAWANRALALHAGLAGSVAFARVDNSLSGLEARKAGVGGGGFVSLSWTLGPGQLFLDGSYLYAPVEHPDFRLEAGGLGAEAGYRVGIF